MAEGQAENKETKGVFEQIFAEEAKRRETPIRTLFNDLGKIIGNNKVQKIEEAKEIEKHKQFWEPILGTPKKTPLRATLDAVGRAITGTGTQGGRTTNGSEALDSREEVTIANTKKLKPLRNLPIRMLSLG